MRLIQLLIIFAMTPLVSIASYCSEFESIIVSTPKVFSADNYYTYHQNHTLVEEWYSTTPLSLLLIKGDIDSFIDGGKFVSEEECFAAILDVINLRYLNIPRHSFNTQSWLQNNYNYRDYREMCKCNDTQVVQRYFDEKHFVSSPSLHINTNLTYLKKKIIKRIRAIEYQLEHKLRYDYAYVGYAALSLVSSGLSAYFSYYTYGQIAEYPDFCEMLKHRGIVMKDVIEFPYKYIILYFPTDSSNNEEIYKKYRTLRKAKEDGYMVPILAAGLSVGLMYFAKELFNCACDPNRDNEYLSYYKKLLRFIMYLEKRGYGEWKLEKH